MATIKSRAQQFSGSGHATFLCCSEKTMCACRGLGLQQAAKPAIIEQHARAGRWPADAGSKTRGLVPQYLVEFRSRGFVVASGFLDDGEEPADRIRHAGTPSALQVPCTLPLKATAAHTSHLPHSGIKSPPDIDLFIMGHSHPGKSAIVLRAASLRAVRVVE